MMKQKSIILIFLFSVIFINTDRLILGENGSLRRLDYADAVIDKYKSGGNYWNNPKENAWNATILRGWPIEMGTVLPQHLGCILSSILPLKVVVPVLEILTELLILVGFYYLLISLFGISSLTAFVGAVLALATYFWYNENPYVTQLTLFPALCAFASFGKIKFSIFTRVSVIGIIFALSYPAYVIPIMPLTHLLAILIYKENRKKNLLIWALIWSAFVLYFLPSVIEILKNYTLSNRALWAIGFPSKSFFYEFKVFISQPTTLFPTLVLFAYAKKKNAKLVIYTLIALLSSVVIVAGISSAEWQIIISKFPIISVGAFFYNRIYNYIGLITLLSGIFIFAKNKDLFSFKEILLRYTLVFGLVAFILSLSNSKKALIALGLFSFLIFSLIVLVKYASKKTWLLLPIAILFLFPLRAYYTYRYEVLSSGLGFALDDNYKYQQSKEPSRIVSIVESFAPIDFYPAQASIKGLQTLDGVSVFYDRRDAAQWLKYIKNNPSDSIYGFKYWNNRIELTYADYEYNPERVLKWLWLNNVEYIRSYRQIDNEFLVFDGTYTTKPLVSIKRWQRGTKEYYIYKIKNPLSRVFAVENSTGSNLNEEQIFNTIDASNVQLCSLSLYNPSKVEFSYSKTLSKELLVSTNFNSRWNLRVDGVLSNSLLKEGPFGMIQISPLNGNHLYSLYFKSNALFIIFSMFAGIVLVFLTFIVLVKNQNSQSKLIDN